MMLKCTLGEHPRFVARFPDGTEIALPRTVHDTLELIAGSPDSNGRRLNDIGTVEEMRQAVASFCREIAAMSAQAADALAWSVLGPPVGQCEESGQ